MFSFALFRGDTLGLPMSDVFAAVHHNPFLPHPLPLLILLIDPLTLPSLPTLARTNANTAFRQMFCGIPPL